MVTAGETRSYLLSADAFFKSERFNVSDDKPRFTVCVDNLVPREKRTASTEAFDALYSAWSVFIYIAELANIPGDTNEAFLDICKKLFHDPTISAEKALEEFTQAAGDKLSDGEELPYLLHVMFTVISFAVQAQLTAASRRKKLAWSYCCDAKYWAGMLTATVAISTHWDPLTANARKAAIARIANDPRQKEKATIYECWQAWQLKPDSYKSKAAFARDMLTKFDHLKSTKVIEDWCREWQTKTGTQQAE